MAWAARGVHGQLRADDLDQVRAGERGLVALRGHLRQPEPIHLLPSRLATGTVGLAAGGVLDGQAAGIGAPRGPQLREGQLFRFARPSRLLRRTQLRRRQLMPLREGEVSRRPLPQLRRALRPGGDALRGDTGGLGDTGGGVHRQPLETA